jgi:hypothetical protein
VTGVERSLLDEDVRCLGEPCRVREHLGDRKVEVCLRISELRWHRVRSEPRGDAACCRDRAQRRQLGLAVEPVPRLRLEGGRTGTEHPGAVAAYGVAELGLRCGACRAHGREDPTARRVELLVGRACGSLCELLDPVAAEACVRVTVDQTRDRAQPTPIELLDRTVEARELAHPTDACDTTLLAENESVLEDLHLPQSVPAQRRLPPRGRRELRQVADEQPGRAGLALPAVAHASCARIGSSTPYCSAVSSASGYPASA